MCRRVSSWPDPLHVMFVVALVPSVSLIVLGLADHVGLIFDALGPGRVVIAHPASQEALVCNLVMDRRGCLRGVILNGECACVVAAPGAR